MADSSIDVKVNLDTTQAHEAIDRLQARVIGKPSLAERVVNFCQGRTQMWLAGFFVAGHVSHFMHRLDATYITFMTTFMGIALGHSIKEDWFDSKKDDRKGDR